MGRHGTINSWLRDMIIDNNGMSWYSIVQLGRKEGFTEAELMASVDALAKGHMIENRGGSYVWINKSSMKVSMRDVVK